MRLTTKSIMQGYNRGLQDSLYRWNKAQQRVLTQRNFNSVSEDPSAANRSFQLRSQMKRNSDHIEMAKHVQGILDEVSTSTLQINKVMTEDININILESVNGTTSPEDKKVYAQLLRGAQKSIVLAANTNFGGRYIFGGANTKDVPFELDEATGQLTYHGLDVNTGLPLNAAPGTAPDIAALDKLADETLYVDLGFGLAENGDRNLVTTSAFNSATPGIGYLGYGVDDDGDPKNVVALLGKMADTLETEPFDIDSFHRMMDKYKGSMDTAVDYEAELGTRAKFIETTIDRLDSSNDVLNERIVSLEQVDMPEAISYYLWQGYAYNAALKVGTDIVSQSLIDFMR